ncbi:helix-turn-helix domain-containing protein [Paenibacillus alkalitolerans]|uniref:helix-turn-helix domain-containing protein n=1 Tax=Paenibacillus alkalitolerans TaxID=2799335 RepID=UPI0018F53933|nr:helix-turn-helix domain-containing protein [Paenibacillus alkalitolerans]
MPKKEGNFYRKSLIWFLVTASIPGLIIGGCVYWFAVGYIERDISVLHQRQIAERAQNIDDQLSYLEMSLSHWAFTPRFGSNLQDLKFIYHFKETWDISKTLLVLQGSHPLIQKVELYVGGTSPVLFKPEYYSITDPALISGYNRMIGEEKHVYWTNRLPAPETSSSAVGDPIVLVHKIPGDNSAPFGVISVTLKRDKVINLLKTMTPYNEGVTLLLDEAGHIVASDNARGQGINAALTSEVSGRKNSSGTFLFDYNGVTYSVSYGKMKRIASDWTYISAAPMTAITGPVVVASNMIIAVSASGLLLAISLSWFASRRVYSPVERLIDDLAKERHSLRQRMEEQRPHARAGFLLQLIQGHLNAYSEEDLRKRMELYGWEVDNHRFRILHIQLTGHEALNERFTHGDESLVTFAAANIIEELAAQQLEQYSVVNFHDLSVALLVMSPDSGIENGTVSDLLQVLGEEITKTVNRIIKMQVTITISRQIGSIQSIPDSFMEVERAAGYRKFINQNQVLHMDKLPADFGADRICYPFALERDIIQAMRTGNKEEAERSVAQFLQELSTYGGTEIHVQQNMLQLLGSIQHAILQSGLNTYHLFKGDNMFGQLSQIREPDKMLQWMKDKVIAPFIEEREARANTQLKRIAEQIIEYLNENYMRDISLDQCADLTGTNPYTLSKLFKQTTGINFIDYVTELRINKAKELLRETDLKINDIAFEVGYQQRYFNRIFKKQVGVTPGQFRASS